MSDTRIAPSILGADFSKLASEVQEVDRAGADVLHIDVMDGRFVPNITVGPMVVAALRRHTNLPLDVHLMIEQPDRYLEQFAEAGADIISVHAETCTHLQRTLAQIRALGKRAGIVLRPHTHESLLEYIWGDLDQVIVMSVNPGFGGQTFLTSQLLKIERVASRAHHLGAAIDLEVDGGVTADNARQVADAGATVLVVGAAIFGKPDRRRALDEIRAAVAR
jgi:ribulose-phosphate 3-epimerase